MPLDKVITLITVKPPRLDDVIGVALGMGARVLYVERIVGLEMSSFGLLPCAYDRVCVETSRRAHKETLDAVINAARSGMNGDGKAFLLAAEARDDSPEEGW
jgi:nitrogen regulatory protein PII